MGQARLPDDGDCCANLLKQRGAPCEQAGGAFLQPICH
jgi:hypothetical protein